METRLGHRRDQAPVAPLPEARPGASRPLPANAPTILVLIGAYWPGNSASGPIQSVIGLCKALGDEFRFRLVARDRPVGGSEAIVDSHSWHALGFADAHYCRPLRFGSKGLGEILRRTHYDALVLNGFFDRELTIPALVLRRIGRAPRRPTLISPRGEFSGGSLGLKSQRKRLYIALARRVGLLSDVWLHATAPHEAEDMRREFPWSRGILEAPNVLSLPALSPQSARGKEAVTRIAFLSRISREKNLDFCLNALRSVRAPVAFDIYGPRSDADYWRECEGLIAALPPHVVVTAAGEIPNSAVPGTLAGYDLFFLPSRGESFGHAIFEALGAGVPALLSDRTPWQGMEGREAGWSLPLDATAPFTAAIERFAAMSADERGRFRRGARRAAEAAVQAGDAVARNRAMFRALIGGAGSTHTPDPAA